MKKLILIMLVSFGVTLTASAQGGGWQRQTPEQRVAAIHKKLDSAFKLEASKLATLDTALTVLFKKQDEKMMEMMAGGTRPDRETMMAERKKYSDARDEMIKAMVSAEQYAIWKETIEPSMRPQRREGGGGNGGN
jgi:periplasmic protein CpxP/Spy